MRLSQLIGPELRALLKENPGEVRHLLDDIHPEDLADVVQELDGQEAGELLQQLPTDYAAQVFERLEDDNQQRIATALGPEAITQMVAEMDSDDRADFYNLLPEELQAALLAQLEEANPEAAEDVLELRQWEETSAGGLMTTQYISLRPEWTLRQARDEIRRRADEAETVSCAYVTDHSGRLMGLVTMRRLLLASAEEKIEDVMIHNIKSVQPDVDQEQAAGKLAKYDLNALPVVDSLGELLGVITPDDVIDVVREEQSEDVHKMGAVEPVRDGYFDTPFPIFLRKRAPWLVILFLGGFLATQTMQSFEGELTRVTELAFYLPLLISAGGNSGSQSSTLIIRGLALGDITPHDWLKVFLREFGQGIVLGGMLALFGVCRAMLAGDGPEFASLVGATIIAIVVLGCVIGALAPIALHGLGVDPATSSTPFIATVVDVVGIAVYLSLARLILSSLAQAAP